MKWSDWYGCYDSSLRGLITSESFAHPAKMAKSLTERIFDHGQAAGYWQPGAWIVDPFGGIGTTGLIGAYRGYNCISVELEAHFVALAHANIDKNARKLLSIGRPIPVHVQGDSRNLREYVAAIAGAVTSPPYADQFASHDNFVAPHDTKGRMDTGRNAYGQQPDNATPGQLGAMKPGDYMATIEKIKADGSITSPPYADSAQSRDGDFTLNATETNPTPRRLDTRTYYPAEMATPGQLGAMNVPSYWEAVAQVYAELYAALQPGGAAAIVVKDYIKKGKRVDLCDQTAAVLEATGFTVVERCKAWLIHDRTAPTLFGEDHTKRVERKSFFRRLAEKNGSPRIDWEEVIWAVK